MTNKGVVNEMKNTEKGVLDAMETYKRYTKLSEHKGMLRKTLRLK